MSFTLDLDDIVSENSNGLLSAHSSWRRVELADIASTLNGFPFDSKKFSSTSGTPLVRIRDIVRGSTETYYNGEVPEQYIIERGDILIGMDGDFNVSKWRSSRALLNQRVLRLKSRNSDHYNEDFLHYVIEGYLQAINDHTPSVTVKHLSSKTVLSIPLPLPPLAEQAQIANKLNELLPQAEALSTRIDSIPPLLKKLRQAVLSAAVSGRLTEDWRKGERANWEFYEAKDICEKVQSGGTPKDGFSKSGIPFLKVYNIVNQKIDFNYRQQYITESTHKGPSAKSITKPGDVVMNIVGPPLGKIAIIPNDHSEWNINQAIALFRPSDRIISGWIAIALEGGESLQGVINESKGSAGQVNISLSQCRSLILPMPPITEQAEIVQRVEKLLAIAKELETRTIAIKSHIKNLKKSILQKAFSGDLTSDWRKNNSSLCSEDNSADALLKMIHLNKGPILKGRKKPARQKDNSMNNKIIKVIDALKNSELPLSGQQLLSAAGYPNDSSTEQLEEFFLDIRAMLNDKRIIKVNRDDDGQDWFSIADKN